MIERLFIGWDRPALPTAARILRARCAPGGVWNEFGVCVVVPGAQAARRLARLLHDDETAEGVGTPRPEILTPSAFLNRCCTSEGKIATPAEAQLAWMAAARGLNEADRRRLAPTVDSDADGPLAWGGVAAQACKLRNATAAECLTIADVAAQCRGWEGFLADHRWDALTRLERAYLDALAAAGRTDRNDACLTALASGSLACEQAVFLVGTQDLNGLERAFLRALSSPVCALIPAPDTEQNGFYECGVLHADAWHDRSVPISDDRLHFVGGTADEANMVCDRIAALDGRYALEEITIGVGDETSAEGLSLRLSVAGIPTFSPFGRPVSRTRPAALLAAIRDYLRETSARNFAALVRHPDLERWLEASLADVTDQPFLPLLDQFLAECLPERLPPTEGLSERNLFSLLRGVSAKGEMSPLRTICAGRDMVDALLAPLRGDPRRLAAWVASIADVLRTVYGAEAVDNNTPEGRQFRRSLTHLTAIFAGMLQVPAALAPVVCGPDALAFVMAEASTQRLPSDDADLGLEMMGWLELALDDAPVLLLTGLHEGCVPKNTGDDSLLPDSLRARLGLADNRRRQARDAFLLRVLLESRSDMHLIVARRGADGSPKTPSRLLFACDAPTAARRVRRFTGHDVSPTRPLFAPSTGLRDLAPPMPSAESLQALRVTGFRDYLTCPYRFYLRHVLNLDAQDDSQDEMDARLFGILLHDCLDGFAHSDASDCADPDRLRDFLRGELRRQVGRRFGPRPTPLLELQIRQAGLRLDAFADWQAQSVRDGWRIEPDLAEQDMTALLVVDDQDFVITGRLDRVDYCPDRGFRIIDYKTGDSGRGPDERHRVRDGDGIRWTDLQLPLYRRLMQAQGKPVAPGELGYVLLSSDLSPVTKTARGSHKGGTGFVSVPWTEDDHADALRCAEDVVRSLRAGIFWPPTDPSPFAPSRIDPGRTDPYSGLCLDACSDRSDWLGLRRVPTR